MQRQTKIDQAKALLQNKEDNSQLVTSKNNLQSSVNQVPSTAGMTQQSIDNYNAKKREAETEITATNVLLTMAMQLHNKFQMKNIVSITH